MTRKKTIRLTAAAALLVAVVATALIWWATRNPLEVDGFTEYGAEKSKVDVSIVNRGFSGITIRSVRANGNEPEQAQLVRSYSGQLVAGGIDDSPTAKFGALSEAQVLPRLDADELQAALKEGDRPIHYGLRIVHTREIEQVVIHYKYLGLSRTKTVNLKTWPR